MSKYKRNKTNAILSAFYEYILITFPIGLYVSFEAIHKNSWSYLATSPEWGIAVIFLIFVSVSRYISSIRKSERDVNEVSIKVFNLLRLIGIIISVIVSLYSVLWDNEILIVFRIILLVISTISFLFLFTISELIKSK